MAKRKEQYRKQQIEDIILANQQLNEWCGTEGINYYEGDTALGFLFKFAVPIAIDKLCKTNYPPITLSRETAIRELFALWLRDPHSVLGDPALALFWVLWQVKEKGNG